MLIGTTKPDGTQITIDTDELWREVFAHWDTIVPAEVASDVATHVVNTLLSWVEDNYRGEKIIKRKPNDVYQMVEHLEKENYGVKRYWMFGYDNYYPGGGFCDHRGSYDSLKDAITAGKNSGYEIYEVVDVMTEKVMKEGSGLRNAKIACTGCSSQSGWRFSLKTNGAVTPKNVFEQVLLLEEGPDSVGRYRFTLFSLSPDDNNTLKRRAQTFHGDPYLQIWGYRGMRTLIKDATGHWHGKKEYP